MQVLGKVVDEQFSWVQVSFPVSVLIDDFFALSFQTSDPSCYQPNLSSKNAISKKAFRKVFAKKTYV